MEQQNQEISKVKIKEGNDPLGLAVKKDKQEKQEQKNQEKQEKNKFVLSNPFSDNKDLFSSNIPSSGPRKVNFNTASVPQPKVETRVLDFGSRGKQQQQSQEEKSKIRQNLFGPDDKPQQQQQPQKKTTLNLQPPQQQQRNIGKYQSKSQNNISPSPDPKSQQNNNSNNNGNSQIQQSQLRQQENSKPISRSHIQKKVSDDKELLISLGLDKHDYMEGETHVTHSDVAVKYLDQVDESYKFFDGILILTNYALRFIPGNERKGDFLKNIPRHSFFIIPLGFVNKTGRTVEKKGVMYSYLEINTKDFRDFVFRFKFNQQMESNEFQLKINRHAFPEDKNQLFAFQYNAFNRQLEEQNQGWKIYDQNKDYERMGVFVAPLTVNLDNYKYENPNSNEIYEFRYVDNSQGQICGTYPKTLVVPFSMNDDLVMKSAKFRSRERLPVLSFAIKNPYKNVSSKYISLWRCSQCKTGISNNRSYEDEKYFRIIGDSFEPLDKTSTDSYYNCHIYDARPKINAMSMQIAGKGFESIDFYKNCKITFLNIGNIHKVRDAQKQLVKAVTSDPTKYLSNLEKSGYFEIIAYILEGTDKIVKKMSQGINVVTHCSDGWDRTSQLCSLVQIIMDPYYRTIEGFQALIEKDWIGFGHQFGIRTGHGNKNYAEEQRSPVFSQFLDCVHQIMNQFPLSFEFNYRFLVDINYHVYSCLFGTFLCNHYQEQKMYNVWESTISLWSYMNQPGQREKYINPFMFEDNMSTQELAIDYNLLSMRLWKEYFLYHTYGSKDRYKIFMECKFYEDNMSIMHKLSKYKNQQLQKLLEQKENEHQDIIKEYNQKLRAREEIIDQQEKLIASLKKNQGQQQQSANTQNGQQSENEVNDIQQEFDQAENKEQD